MPYNDGGLKFVLGCEWCRVIGECKRILLDADVDKSKMAQEMLCFTIEPGVVGREGRICETAGAGHSRAIAIWFRIVAVESNVRNTLGECNCRLLDAL